MARPFKYHTLSGEIDIQEINRRIDNYLEEAGRKDAYSIAGLCLALDIDTDTLLLWSKGFTHDPKDDEDAEKSYIRALSATVKRAKMHIQKWLAEVSDKNRQSKDIFLLKNWFGMVDKQEQEVNVNANIKLIPGKLDELSR